MIECPNCFNAFAGPKCSCGYVPPRVTPIRTDATKSEPALTQASREWLESAGIHKPGMTRAEKTRANLDYMKRLTKTAKPDPRAWAHSILSDIESGVVIHPYVAACAREAIGPQKEQERAAA